MLARRLLLLAAVLMLLTALASGVAPREPVAPSEPPAAGQPLPAGTTVARTIRTEPGTNTQVPVRRGDVLELEVAGDTLDSVLLERLDQIEAVEPTTPARFELLIDAPAGTYPIRLLEADRRIGSIEIRD